MAQHGYITKAQARAMAEDRYRCHTCPDCGKVGLSVKPDGTLYRHTKPYFGWHSAPKCYYTGKSVAYAEASA
jgi:hypothetical protein